MGSHTWDEQCSYCGFEGARVSSYDGICFEATCPICGYARWTEERVPNDSDVELAKHKLAEMHAEEKEKAIELYYEDGIFLINRTNR
ncbi:MAG: hypothetical protein ACE5K8_08105 [Candidatus Zixiibacteriota bacterium]